MSKKRVPQFVRWRYAMDATPEIKGVEASPAALTDAKAVIDAQEAGVAPRNIGVDLDKDASIDEIVLKFFPGASPEDAETIRALLMKYKTAPATMEVEDGDDEPLTAAAPEAVPAAAGAVKDGDTPDEQRAFAEGVKYGEEVEKKEPEHLDRLHESIGEKKALGEVTDADGETYTKEEVDAKIAALMKDMEAKIEAAKVKATDEAKEHYEGLSKAAQDCAPLVKIADPMAYKSSAEIYRKALKLRGVAADSMPDSALPAMVDFVKRNAGASAVSRPIVAADAAPAMDADFDVIKALEKRIKVY